MKNKNSVATILGQELQPKVGEWLRRAKPVPELAVIPLSDEERWEHLPRLFRDVICRLTVPESHSLSASAVEQGPKRAERGYSPAMLVEESKRVQIVTFLALHLRMDELFNPSQAC